MDRENGTRFDSRGRKMVFATETRPGVILVFSPRLQRRGARGEVEARRAPGLKSWRIDKALCG